MSHYLLVVTNTDKKPLNEQLEPFSDDYEEEGPYTQRGYYLYANEKDVKEFLDKQIEDNKIELAEAKESNSRSNEYEKYLERQIARFEYIGMLPTLGEKLNEIQRIEGDYLDEKGLYCVFNPNGQYDYYDEGGRWKNWLVTKDGKKCNRCKVKDLDLDKVLMTELKKLGNYFSKVMKVYKKHGVMPYLPGYDYIPSRKEYVNPDKIWLAPHAILHDGEWISYDDIGWWGEESSPSDKKEWESFFKKTLEKLDQESEITIVDCHI